MKRTNTVVASIIVIFALSAIASAATVDISGVAVSQGGSSNVSIVARNVANLANFGLTLYFNPSVVNVINISNNPLLSPGDCLSPPSDCINEIHNGAGYASIGSLNIMSKPSLNGDIVLANVTLKAVGNARTVSFLNLSIGRLSDNTDAEIPATAVTNGTFTIVARGDANNDGLLTMADAMFTGKAALGKPGFTKDPVTMDVDGELGITVNDALYLAKHIIGVSGFETLH